MHTEMPSHSHRKQSKAKSPILSSAMYKSAYLFGMVIFVLVIVQLMITLLLSVSKDANEFDVYSRNFSSIVGFALIALFLIRWCYFNLYGTAVRLFKCITISAAIVCGIKGLLSIYYTVSQSSRGIYVIAYYAGDILAWLVLSAFLFAYKQMKISKNAYASPLKPFRNLTILLAAVSLLKAASAGLYTMLNYRPGSFPWLYYLADTAAWLILFAFFATYSRSKLVKKSMHKKSERDTSLDAKIEMAARTKSQSR